jgi:hypothetical protein
MPFRSFSSFSSSHPTFFRGPEGLGEKGRERAMAGYATAIAMIVLFVVAATALAAAPAHSLASAQEEAPTGLIVPLFWYNPAQAAELSQAKLAHPSVSIIAIINQYGGPGNAYNSTVAAGVGEMESAGILVFGYVASSWGEGNISLMEAQMREFKNWYKVDGIYLDQMANWEFNSASVYLPTYYALLREYANSIGIPEVAGNSGADVPYYFIGSLSTIGIYENSGVPPLSMLRGTLVEPGWHAGYDKTNFWFVAYNVTSPDPSYVLSASDYVSYLYLTNETRADGYARLPPYFDSLVSTLSSIVPVTIQSMSTGGTSVTNGAFAVKVTQPDGSSTSCMAPCTFDAYSGTEVKVSLTAESGYSFSGWGDGGGGGAAAASTTTSPVRTIDVTGPVALTAYSSAIPPRHYPVTVLTTATDGTPLTGLSTHVSFANGTYVASGYTPLTFQAEQSVAYSIAVDSYGNYKFSHWSTGATSRALSIAPTNTTSISAYFVSPVSHTNMTKISPNTFSLFNGSAPTPLVQTSTTAMATTTTSTSTSPSHSTSISSSASTRSAISSSTKRTTTTTQRTNTSPTTASQQSTITTSSSSPPPSTRSAPSPSMSSSPSPGAISQQHTATSPKEGGRASSEEVSDSSYFAYGLLAIVASIAVIILRVVRLGGGSLRSR